MNISYRISIILRHGFGEIIYFADFGNVKIKLLIDFKIKNSVRKFRLRNQGLQTDLMM